MYTHPFSGVHPRIGADRVIDEIHASLDALEASRAEPAAPQPPPAQQPSNSNKRVAAVVGATGAVGKEMVRVLREAGRTKPIADMEIRLFASARSAGTVIDGLVVEEFSVEKVRSCDVALLAVSGSFSKEHSDAIAAPGGAVVIDNSSALRLVPTVPLVVPEINASAIGESNLIANPNCTTAIAVMALWPIHKAFGLKKVIMSSYQAASGAGVEGMKELTQGCQTYLSGEQPTNKVFSHPLPFNVIPHIDTFQENGYTKEEMKVTWETRKIFGSDDLPVSCTAVRIPTIRAHAEAITIETEQPVTPESITSCLMNAPGVEVVDDPEAIKYPMPLTASKKDDVEVGRIRQSLVFGENGADLFVCGDQLLRGAALNAVLIAEAVAAQRGW